MEVNLQFDDEGRTRCSAVVADYSTKAVMTTLGCDDHSSIDNSDSCLKPSASNGLLDNILQDCEIADSDLMPHTFWMPALSTDVQDRPRCLLESMALQVFQHHVSSSKWNTNGVTNHGVAPILTAEERSKSGAEWWVQIRPSSHDHHNHTTTTTTALTTTTSEQSNHDDDDDKNDDDDDMSKSGIAFHWDKDEELRQLAGGNLYIHPHISTVTYLTSIGAPTMVCHRRIHPLTGDWIKMDDDDNEQDASVANGSSEGYLSWPKLGKHLSFDGGYLHAAPPDLLQKGQFERQCQMPHSNGIVPTVDHDEQIRLVRRRRRVTFLVNIWLNHKPVNVERFPEGMLNKMSKVSSDDWELFESPKPLPISVIDVAEQPLATTFTWPMGSGGSHESISAPIPVEKVQEMAPEDRTIHLRWSKDAPMVLSKGEKLKRTECESAGSDCKRIRRG
ncbi:hypothetical protein MHU86_3592 [Fragilaria crotonensis]|nr:hypothetical protein MHU86_3592 [Fragilaria crotonensis]